MSSTLILLRQIFIMFLLMIAGYGLRKKQLLSLEGASSLSNLMLYICGPAIMILSFDTSFSYLRLQNMGIAFLFSVLITLVSIFLAKLFMSSEQTLEQFGIIFCNSGFIGLPLVQNILGTECVFYLTIYMAVFTLFVWTYEIYLISKGKTNIKLSKAFLNPAMFSVFIGFFLFCTPFTLPDIVHETFQLLGDCNTPLGMIVLGSYLANSSSVHIFTSKEGYKVSFFRLIVVPLCTVFVMMLLPMQYYDIRMTLLIANSTPVGVMLAMFSQMYAGDFEYGARIVSLSTQLSLISIPLVLSMTNILW